MDGEGSVTYGTTTGSSSFRSSLGGGGGGSLYSFLPSGWEAGKPVVAQGPTTAPPAFTPMPSQASAFYGGYFQQQQHQEEEEEEEESEEESEEEGGTREGGRETEESEEESEQGGGYWSSHRPTFPTTAMPMSQHLANAVDEEDEDESEEDDDYEQQQQQQWGWQQEQFRRMEAEALLRRKEIEGQLAKLNAEKVDAENSGGVTTKQEEEEEEEGTARRLLEKEKEIENLRKELEEKNELVRQLASAKSKERSTRDTYASTITTDRKQKRVSNGEVSLDDAESLLDTMQLERPKWVEDKYAASCQRCTIPFSTFKRRHHCRGCGKVFCHECSNTWLLLPKALGYPTPQRTCEACYRSLSTLDYSTFHDIYGPEDAPVLVLLHAAFATRKSFGRQIEALQSRYKLLIPDLPGHGSRSKEKLTMNSAIRVIEDILAKYASHSKSITLVGFSLGGYIAMAFAATHPSLVTAIIVAGAEVGMPGGAVSGLLRNVKMKTLGSFKGPGNPWNNRNLQISQQLLEELFVRPGCYHNAWEDIKQMQEQENYEKYLKSYPGHVLFLHGELEYKKTEEKWLVHAQNGNVHLLDGAHSLFLVDDRFYRQANEAILEFADAVGAWKERMQETEKKRLEALKKSRTMPISANSDTTQKEATTGGGAALMESLKDSPTNSIFDTSHSDWIFQRTDLAVEALVDDEVEDGNDEDEEKSDQEQS